MLEANSRPLQELILEQSNYLAKPDSATAHLDQIRKQVKQIDKLTKKDSDQTYLGAKGSYWLSLKRYNPVFTSTKLGSQRLLIVQGGDDYQVTKTDFNLWKKSLNGKKNIQFEFFEKLNHALIEGNGSMSPDEYNIPGNVPLYLVNLIVTWINKN